MSSKETKEKGIKSCKKKILHYYKKSYQSRHKHLLNFLNKGNVDLVDDSTNIETLKSIKQYLRTGRYKSLKIYLCFRSIHKKK